MIIARQSTARTVTVGPVLDADGVAVTDGVVADFKVAKNGGAPAALNASATLVHRNTGHYSLALTASDLDTVGQAEVVIDDTVNACPMKEITVIEEAVYDALFAASAAGYGVAQTGDAYAIASSGTHGNAALKALIDLVKAKTDNLPAAAAGAAGGLLIWGTIVNGSINQTVASMVDANIEGLDGEAYTASATPIDAVLTSAGLDAVLVESGISAGAGLTNDTGTQLTAINARQALSLKASSLGGVVAGAATTEMTFKPAGLPAGNTRITAVVDSDGNRSAITLKVPD